MKLLCKLGLHKWGGWSFNTGPAWRIEQKFREPYRYIDPLFPDEHYKRTCLNCGKVKRRTLDEGPVYNATDSNT